MYKLYENELLTPNSTVNMRQMQMEILFVSCLVYFNVIVSIQCVTFSNSHLPKQQPNWKKNI